MKEQELSSVGHGYALVSLALEAAVKRRKQMLCVGKATLFWRVVVCDGLQLCIEGCCHALEAVVCGLLL